MLVIYNSDMILLFMAVMFDQPNPEKDDVRRIKRLGSFASKLKSI